MLTRLILHAFRLSLLALAVVFFGGCAANPGAGRYVVSAPKSQFYKYGPAQAFGADFALNRGQKVTVVENSFGFSKVTTEDGIAGYMPTEDLTPLPPEPAPQVRSMPRIASRRVGAAPKHQPSTIEPGLLLFDGTDIPLPTKSEPSKKPHSNLEPDLPKP